MEIVSLSTAKSRRKAIEKLLSVAKVRRQRCDGSHAAGADVEAAMRRACAPRRHSTAGT
mgnify:CR=1 FL=1